MLVSNDIRPNKSLYFLGAIAINFLITKDGEFDFWDLYNAMNTEHSISLKLTILTLDWLFLIDAIEMTEKGGLKKCL